MTRRNRHPSIVILTGAGISRESGLHTFRDADGIWAQVDLEDVATPEGFASDPVRVQAFYNDRRLHLRDGSVQPNAAHRALARLELAWPGELLLVTQNIDDLHERAGSLDPLHMHGELLKARCTGCHAVHLWVGPIHPHDRCPSCERLGALRPHVVWFSEIPLGMERIGLALKRCGLFISIGTSGNVYPAAGFVADARAAGARTVELNLEPSRGEGLFDEGHYGLATEVVPTYVERLIKDGIAC